MKAFKINDLHWAAGFLEGEGYFGGNEMRITCAQVQLEPLERLVKLFGGSILPLKTYKPIHKPAYHWRVYGSHAAGLMMTLWSLMSFKRRQQIEKALAIWKPRQTRSKSYRDTRGR